MWLLGDEPLCLSMLGPPQRQNPIAVGHQGKERVTGRVGSYGVDAAKCLVT
jgi:hypothetical protein